MKTSRATGWKRRAHYGIDMPWLVLNYLSLGAAGVALGFSVPAFDVSGFTVSLLGPTLLALGLLSLCFGLSMLAYALRGKLNVRDRMLNAIDWTGNEAVLDIGTGRGLLVIGAAKRLTTGTAIGIDIWSPGALSGNTLENALTNVAREGVEDKVDLRHDDAGGLAYVDRSFDVVLCLLRANDSGTTPVAGPVCREIARVLKPGGKAVIAGNAEVQDYAHALAAAGLKAGKPRSQCLAAYMPLWIVAARKP